MSPPAQEVYELPEAAVRTLGEPSLKLELHGIGFSHYVERARWALRLVGLPFSEVNYLPLAHTFGIIRLQKRFKQGPGKATASSGSPAATPVLAIYTADKKPLCLISNSALIMRYAVLRAQALGNTNVPLLYGPSLTVDTSTEPPTVTGSDEVYKQTAEMELRLSGTLGVEVRRVMYYYLLPQWSLAGLLFNNNSSGWQKTLSGLIYFISKLLLPKFLNINERTAARGVERLLQEFDYLDSIVLKQQHQHMPQQSDEKAAAAPASADRPSKLPSKYLVGQSLTAADVSLAVLGGHLVRAPYTQWMPKVEDYPGPLRSLVETMSKRPTAKLIQDIWRAHGPTSTQNFAETINSEQASAKSNL